MTLADQLMAARGEMIDLGGIVTSISKGIERAERFVMSDDVSLAAFDLCRSKPSSLLAAMPLCRLPYKKIWVEWNGGLLTRAGLPLEVSDDRPEPVKMGCLIEQADHSQRGVMSWAWVHNLKDDMLPMPNGGINVCGLSVNFDWSPEGDVKKWADEAGVGNHPFVNHWISTNIPADTAKQLMRSRRDWSKLADDPVQVEAVRELLRHEAPWPSAHASGLLHLMAKIGDAEGLRKLIEGWENDIRGEAPFISAFIMMLNSRNAVEHQRDDLTRLNRARAKRGKPALLEHNVTRLYLSKTRARVAAAAGISRDRARQHLVRGHFKLRVNRRTNTSNLFWWSPFLRGDAKRPMQRERYAVVE